MMSEPAQLSVGWSCWVGERAVVWGVGRTRWRGFLEKDKGCWTASSSGSWGRS